ncbi:response regulator [Alkalinema sp. FACHB-956]|uniref:response regulator n=1 Tax=Alkalinema sp. FACHB-956 TaxID=2692768 RepID=UPI001682E56E|nr:response regulator [Alkalinema sp. FACHB-956]MBD2328166.1 response regulator [Alkalinema sp. FACHB-956]
MNTLSSVSYRSFERLHPLNLLAQLSSRQTTGRLQVTSEATVWSIYLDRGQLTYATNLVDPFGRLERHLEQLAMQLPSLTAAIREEARSRFEHSVRNQANVEPDYRAICWLVDQGYLLPADAIVLIENLAKEVLEGFLEIKAGRFLPIDSDVLAQAPSFGQLELKTLVEHCQSQIRQRYSQVSNASATPTALRLPQLSLDPPLSATRSVAEPPQNAEQPLAKDHYTIVCIDDSPTVLQAINCFLDDQNFSVIMINDPVKALMQVVRSKPDLILLDVGMPNLDGYELCSLLRRHPTSKTIPIIMVTGHTGFIDRAKAKLVGASGYLTKPFNQADLLKTVFKHLT